MEPIWLWRRPLLLSPFPRGGKERVNIMKLSSENVAGSLYILPIDCHKRLFHVLLFLDQSVSETLGVMSLMPIIRKIHDKRQSEELYKILIYSPCSNFTSLSSARRISKPRHVQLPGYVFDLSR